ncbi:MAG: 3-dehydroquinate synthase [Bacteroidetes bacterium]|nr:3-dehydroquinate synthase [Bacteroidota bacterium]
MPSCAIRTQKNTAFPVLQKHLKKVKISCIITIKPGERFKNTTTLLQIIDKLNEHFFSRNDILLNLGGGIITDTGGFAASIFKRGINYYHIPTTLLAMIDAAHGSKTGVNRDGIKNNIGTFYKPSGVVIENAWLTTLPKRQLNNGFAEALKHALIADRYLWQIIKGITASEFAADKRLVARCIEIKNDIIEQDMHELNLRRILNFGHTIGHALESYFLTQAKPLLHGEAVLAGMLAESYILHKSGVLPSNDFDEIKHVFAPLCPRLTIKQSQLEAVMKWMHHDKKNQTSKIGIIPLHAIGQANSDLIFPKKELLKKSLDFLVKLPGKK